MCCPAVRWHAGAETEPMPQTITSLTNPTVKHLVKLRQRRARDAQGLLLIDGARALRLALQQGFPLTALYVAEDTVPRHADVLHLARTVGVPQHLVSSPVFHKIGYGDHPDGLLGVAVQPDVTLAALQAATPALYLVAEGLEKPGNLGAILRSADAAGVHGVLICESHTDIWNPNVIRASQGAFCTVKMAVAPAQEVRVWLRQHQIQILVATPSATQCYTASPLWRPSAFVLGAEHTGVSTVWQQETAIRIPMAGQVDSLNVAQTASILIFEAVRQRQQYGLPLQHHDAQGGKTV
ncbi:MAG: RNA methyltransferase [Candidatus Tectomicrobia bacterium]|uniref:RNA methyltransferase n=1 Tax=Tectimicrobiota bacterium TaxID=2528274 RepID=A0A938B4L8_UNCTE|nr:RNA methyltransferase [Candidatus Tectomicrobia bacterium]